MHPIKFIAAFAAAAILTGCAHSLVIAPNTAKLEALGTQGSVGYYISEEQRTQEVISPGGGGDKVSYFPYRDVDMGMFKIIGNCFADVVRLKSRNAAAAVSEHKIAYIVTPQLKTDSSSPSPFTWPPTQFTVDLSASITDKLA